MRCAAALSPCSAAVSKRQRLVVPVRVVQHHVLEELDRLADGLWPGQIAPHELAAAHQRGKQFLLGRRLGHRRIDATRGLDLRSGQTRRPVRALALDHLRIEAALARIVDQPVLQAIVHVTGVHGRLVNGGKLAGWNETGLGDVHRVRDPQLSGHLARPEVHRRGGDDAVVVGGIAPGFHERLPPAVRAAVPVGSRRRVAVEGGGDRLGGHGHLVHRAVAVVDHLLGVTRHEPRTVADVSRVGASGGVATRDGGRPAPDTAANPPTRRYRRTAACGSIPSPAATPRP